MNEKNSTETIVATAADAPETVSDEALETVDGGYRYELKNVIVSSYSMHGNPGDKLGNFEIQDLMTTKG